MFINVPRELKRKDIKYLGDIFKGNGFSYILSDIENTDIKNTLNLNGQGFYSYVYDILDTYLFIIGNHYKRIEINPNKVNFLSKILEFEHRLSNNKKIADFDIPNNVLTLVAKSRWLADDLTGNLGNTIDFIIQTNKIHLQGYESRYKRHLYYLCDSSESNMTGLCKYGMAKYLVGSNKVKVFKDTSIDGYIIKYNMDNFL